jgi:glycosyltransferase involved in cell wall biosynthesis
MTHDPSWLLSLLTDPSLFKATLFYDLIPLEEPERYLVSTLAQADFVTCVYWLRAYDCFAAISDHSGKALCQEAGVAPERVFVSGVAIRHSLEPLDGEAALPRQDRRHILVTGGGDARKNVVCALEAHAASPTLRAGPPLAISGNYAPSLRAEYRALYAKKGGVAQNLSFLDHLSDDAFRLALREAIVTIVPSRSEGFSIPVVESSAAGTPVLVSDIGAHAELISDPSCRFDPDDPDALGHLVEEIVADEAVWARIGREQAELWTRFSVERVAANFLEGILARFGQLPAKPAVVRGARPKLAILTPLPPAPSGVAAFSAATLTPLAEHADIISSPIRRIPTATAPSCRSHRRQPSGVYRRFDAVVSVVGNSDHHVGAFSYLLEHGGAAIAHDARMINFYLSLLGMERALQVAHAEGETQATPELLEHWVHNQRDLPILFLSEIVKAASPLIVHSHLTADRIQRLYGSAPRVLPFAQYRTLERRELSQNARLAARRTLGWRDEDFVVCTFGNVADDRAPDELVWATKLLRDWNVPARFSFCGRLQDPTKNRVLRLIKELGLESDVDWLDDFASQDFYDRCLVAADAAVQLRTHLFGSLSGALSDCIAAALPCVSNDHLARAIDAPVFVRRVPDYPSPLLIAEALLNIRQSGDHRERPVAAAEVAQTLRSPKLYADMLLETLGFPVPRSGLSG